MGGWRHLTPDSQVTANGNRAVVNRHGVCWECTRCKLVNDVRRPWCERCEYPNFAIDGAPEQSPHLDDRLLDMLR